MDEQPKLTEEQQETVLQWINLPLLLLKRLHRPHASVDDANDLMQTGRLALYKAALKHDPARATFSTYAYVPAWRDMCQQNRFLQGRMYSRNDTITTKSLKREADKRLIPVSQLPGHEFPGLHAGILERTTAEEEELPADREERVSKLRELLLSLLPERERTVIALRLDGQGLQEIGERLGVTKQRVGQIEQQALKRLQQRRNLIEKEVWE